MKTRDLHSHPDSPHPGDDHPSHWIAKPYSFVFTAVVLFILIFGIAIFLGYRQVETARHNVLANDKTTANLLADLIFSHNKATIGILQSYAHQPRFIDAVKNKDLVEIHRHLSDLKKNAEIDLTFVTGKRGILWANFPVFPEAIGKDLSSRDWYKGISSHWKPYISTVFQLIIGNKPLAAAVCVPILDEKERVIGILATSQRLGFLIDAIHRVPLSPYTTVTVIDRAGQMLYSNKFSYQASITAHRFFPMIESALKGEKQQIEMNDPQKDQEKSYLTVIPAGDSGWSVIIERSLQDIYRSEFRHFIEIGAISFLLFLLIFFYLIYLRKASLLQKTEELLQTETKLRQSEAKYRLMFETTISGFALLKMIYDEEGKPVDCRYEDVNPAHEKLTGLKNREILGRTARECIPNLENHWIENYGKVDQTGEPMYVANRVEGLNRFYGVLAYRPVPGYIAVTFEDITGRKKAEEALQRKHDELEQRVVDRTEDLTRMNEELLKENTARKEVADSLQESEEKYRILFNNEIYAICIFDLETLTLLDANDAYSQIYGYSREELISGMTIHDITAEHQVSDAATQQAIREGTIFIPLRYHRKKDGTVFPVEIVGGPYNWKGRKVMFALAHDITYRKQAEEALWTQNKTFSQVLNGLDALVYVVDMKTYEIVFINTYGQNIWGDIKGKICWQVIQTDKAGPCEYCTNSQLIGPDGNPTEGVVWEFQNTVNKRWYDCRDSAIYWHDGRIVRMEIAADITERKRAEADKEKLEALNRQLQKAESLGRMAGAIAHTFNNRLGAVIGNLDMALGKLPRGAEPIENLTAAMQAAGKAAEVSGLMLTYLGQVSYKREPLDLSETCCPNLPLLRAAMPGKVVLETDFPSPGPVISANANQIQQVLTNLVTNAWEAVGEDGGSIHLRVKMVSPAEIPAVHCYPLDWQPRENAYACLEVTDTGCAIAGKDIENLFDPFFSSKFTGRGLGLPVVLGIVRAHGGAVTVESEPGQGTTFRVFFPVSVEEILRKPHKEVQVPEMEGGGTVLLVEDEAMVRTMAKRMLTHLGFTVLEAKDGVEAVEVFRQHQNEIRCVLCDLTMPRMNGWETLTALRKLAPDVPVILASGYDKAQVMSGDHPEWPQVFLGKPYRIKELSVAISQALISRK